MTDQIDAVEADEPEVLAEAQQEEIQTEAAEAEVVEEQPKPKKSAQERINEVTAARREAEREGAYWRKVALEKQEAAPLARQEPVGEPDPAAYPGREDDSQYIIAVAEHRAAARVRAEMQAQRAEEDGARAYASFEQKVAEQFPDGEPEGLAALKALPAIRREITDVIFASDLGPSLAAHLGDNPSALRRLEGLPAHMVGFELAKIEAALAAPPKPKTITNAPPPAPQVRGQGGRFSVPADTNDFAAFEKAFSGK